MGADLYLPDVLQACHQRYGRAAALAEQLISLVEGKGQPQIVRTGRQLKEALVLHARRNGEMAPALFDQVAEAADLAQGELAVATRVLAGQVAVLVQAECASMVARDEGLGAAGPLTLIADLLTLLTARADETILRRGAVLLAQHLLARRDSATLMHAGLLIGEVLAGNSHGVLSLLVERRLLPALEHARTAQADCLQNLEDALAPLVSDLSASPETAESPAARALLQFHRLACALLETIAHLHQQLTAGGQTEVARAPLLPDLLEDARTCLEELWNEEENLHTQTRAIEALRPLFMRTLPPHPDQTTHQQEGQASPLQRVVGCLMEHHMLWPTLLQMLTRELETVRTILTGDSRAALSELCCIQVFLLGPDQAQPGATSFQGPHLPISPGVLMVGTDLMGYCYLQTMSVAQQARHDAQLRTWVEDALSETPVTASTSGLLLRFWRLLQGDSSLWREVLIGRLRATLDLQMSTDPVLGLASNQLDTLLAELQGLLEERPYARLQTLLTRIQAEVAADSPLIPAAQRLQAFLQGDLTEALGETLAQLEEEIETGQGWPQDRRRDALWLLTLARTLWRTRAAEHGPLLCATLRAACDEDGSGGARVRARLPRDWPADEPGQRQLLLDLLTGLQEVLPETGLQSPNADLRTLPDWKLRLLRTLLQTHLVVAGHADAYSEHTERPCELLALPPVLQKLQGLLLAWRFPPQGYFRDSYNDTVRRGGAYEIAGSSGRG
ncbi:MAG TPA: hypothetical protein VGF67_21655 [Ktedonobacteraceae bacterium]|jgi:hypothetical protein